MKIRCARIPGQPFVSSRLLCALLANAVCTASQFQAPVSRVCHQTSLILDLASPIRCSLSVSVSHELFADPYLCEVYFYQLMGTQSLDLAECRHGRSIDVLWSLLKNKRHGISGSFIFGYGCHLGCCSDTACPHPTRSVRSCKRQLSGPTIEHISFCVFNACSCNF